MGFVLLAFVGVTGNLSFAVFLSSPAGDAMKRQFSLTNHGILLGYRVGQRPLHAVSFPFLKKPINKWHYSKFSSWCWVTCCGEWINRAVTPCLCDTLRATAGWRCGSSICSSRTLPRLATCSWRLTSYFRGALQA